ncbi:unnamed protein product [Linum trigynum]|uniref:Retrotransposon gag domain-containing protein n=1 Tax=Linum trigynum TaxID=586398 RepID=A0AAV2EW22_9ROSI
MISSLRQDKRSISAFYTKLRGYWDEMDAVGSVPRCVCNGCTCDGCSCDLVAQNHEKQETERMFEFLLGLDDGYAFVRSQILSTKPVPTLNEAYQIVAAEEQHRLLTNGRRPIVDIVVFQAQTDKGRKEEIEKTRCTNCNKLGHTREICYRLIGFSLGHLRAKSGKNWGNLNQSRPQAAHVEPETGDSSDNNPIPGLTGA